MAIETGKDKYYVAVKVFFVKKDKLLILKDSFGDWDLPGGRLKMDEFETPLEEVISRKMIEELGVMFKFKVKAPVVFLRHERTEAVTGSPTVRIFAVGYLGEILNEKIQLSKRHTEFRWVPIMEFHPEEYFIGGWLKGVREFVEIYKTGLRANN